MDLTARVALTLGVTGLAASLGSPAYANPASDVTSAGDVPAQVLLDYAYQLDTATITRERVGGTDIDPLNGIPRGKDLEFNQFRHVLTPRLELGLLTDTWLSASLPIIIGQARELTLASGIDRTGSSTLRDGFLPPDGFDARDPSAAPPGDLVFRGVSRSGIDQVSLGLNVAPMNQRRDDTKPTWKIGAEIRLAIGKVMRFDAMNPSSQTGVGKGVHELSVWTTVDRRFERLEGWFGLYWLAPVATRSTSLFQNPGFGATNSGLGQQAGVGFGLETYFVNDKQTGNRISVDVGARIAAHFEGRDYSPMWEVFSYAGDTRGSGPLVLDGDPTDMGVQPLGHPGISNVENYLETAGRFALRAVLGKHVRFAALVDMSWKTDHVITFADAGIDLPTCGGSATSCENTENDLVNPGTVEVNPLHAPNIDLVGHRYHAESSFGMIIGVEGQFLF